MAARRLSWVMLLLAASTLTIGACTAPGTDTNTDEDLGSDEAALRGPLRDKDGRLVLPNWATRDELAVERAALPPAPREENAPLAGYRVPAEYEPVDAVVMTWAGHTEVLKGISVATAAAGARVWMVGGPPSIAGVSPSLYRALPYGFNSVWARDYGPVGINEATRTLGIVDTTYRHYAVRRDDDAVSCKLAEDLGAECHPTNLILDGGNYMSDSKGRVFVTKRIYEWNSSMTRERVDELLKSHLGATEIHALDYAKNASGQPADGTGHIDMFAKLISDCKVIVAETKNEPFKTVTDKAAAYFGELPCGPNGGRYEITRVKGWLTGRTWYTYTNSLIVNKTVVMPFYNTTADNEVARAAYQAALPGYEIIGVNSESTIVQGGSIHCITKEIPRVNDDD